MGESAVEKQTRSRPGRPGLSGKERELRRLSRSHMHRLGPAVVRGFGNLISLSPLAYKRMKAVLEDENADPRVVVAATRLLLRGFNDILDRIGLPRRHEIDADMKTSILTPDMLADGLARAMQAVAEDPNRGAVTATDAEYEIMPNGDQTIQ